MQHVRKSPDLFLWLDPLSPCPDLRQEPMQAPMPWGTVPLQDEGSKGWRRSAVRDKGSSDLQWYLQEQGGCSRYWCLDKQCVEAGWVSDPSWTAAANAPTPTLHAHTTHCFRTVPIWGEDVGTEREQSQLSLTSLGLLLWQHGTCLHPSQGDDGCWTEGKPPLTSSSDSSPSISSPTFYQGYSYQHTLRKDLTHLHSKSALPPKPLGTHRFYVDAPA